MAAMPRSTLVREGEACSIGRKEGRKEGGREGEREGKVRASD